MDKEWESEQLHFNQCRRLIGHNIDRYEKEYEQRHKEVAQLYRALQSGDVELYNQLMTRVSLEEHAKNQLRKNQAAYEKPFFGRIDYTDLDAHRKEQVYIGKNGVFRNRTEVVIADWRAPISSVYYENELGRGTYSLPSDEYSDKKVNVDLKLKRTYDVEQGKLLGYYDSDVASNDQLLVQYLAKNKEVVLGEIIATIQKEQNEIIRERPFCNILVQGVAGSGKTTVAMHRISYILYNYKERFESNEFCIIGSSDLLLNYITSGLPELDVPNIKHMRMDQLFVHLLGREWRKKYRFQQEGTDAALRSKLDFILQLELFLMHFREERVDCREVRDPKLGVLLSASNNERLLRENPRYSINRMLALLDERLRTRIKFLADGMEKEEIQEKLREYRDHYKSRRPTESIYVIYLRFLDEYARNKKKDMAQHMEMVQKGRLDLYDLAALTLIRYRVTQKAEDEEFGLMFLDEAQDFGITVYYVLKTVLPKCYFTIMGDVSQNINYETGLNDWDELIKLFLTGPKDRFRILKKSYRNTIEISEYAGRILDKASFGRYKIEPVIRHGKEVEEGRFSSREEMAERAAKILQENLQDGYKTLAIICRDEEQAAEASQLLSKRGITLVDGAECGFAQGIMALPIRMVKGLEFDTVILWNPDVKTALSRPDEAKLLYVAATRALHELHVLSCTEK